MKGGHLVGKEVGMETGGMRWGEDRVREWIGGGVSRRS